MTPVNELATVPDELPIKEGVAINVGDADAERSKEELSTTVCEADQLPPLLLAFADGLYKFTVNMLAFALCTGLTLP